MKTISLIRMVIAEQRRAGIITREMPRSIRRERIVRAMEYITRVHLLRSYQPAERAAFGWTA